MRGPECYIFFRGGGGVAECRNRRIHKLKAYKAQEVTRAAYA
jgi:hypothetical protein